MSMSLDVFPGVTSVQSDISASLEDVSTVLIVDDHEVNRVLLEELLEPHGYQLLQASSGEEALARLREHAVDLVLLDITMPGMDGLEVCRRIRSEPSTASLPVIMVTALAHRQQQLEGITAGASDYLTKPIDSANLLLRVRNALQLRRLHVRIAAQLSQLQALEKMRDSLVHMLVHDLRAPLQAMVFGLDFSRDRARELEDDQLLDDLDSVVSGARLMTAMVNNVLDVSRFEANAMPLRRVRFDLCTVTREAVASVAAYRGVDVHIDCLSTELHVTADADLIRRVIANLVSNACKFSEGRGDVRVLIQTSGSGVEVQVIDAGPGIAAAHHDAIFDKFGQVTDARSNANGSSGLGLTFCKLAVERHGGTIGVTSEAGEGATFWFRLQADAG